MAMSYYIQSVEQIIKDGALAEYGSTERVVTDENTALNKYYKKLSDVSADIGVNHTYMRIRVENSVGGIIKSDAIGEYLLELPEESTESEG